MATGDQILKRLTDLETKHNKLAAEVSALKSRPTAPVPAPAPSPPPPAPVPPAPTPSAPPPAALPPNVKVLPKITAPNKVIGVLMTRVVGQYATGQTPIAGAWYASSDARLIGQMATCPSDKVKAGETVTYVETIRNAQGVQQLVRSLPFGPFVAAPTISGTAQLPPK